MKLLIINEEPIIKKPDANYSDLESLNQVMNAAYEEVIVNDQLDFVKDKESALKNLISKLKYNGIISLSGVDALEISRKLMYGDMSMQDWNNIIYSRLGLMCLEDVVKFLSDLGLIVLEKRLVNETFFIKAKRNAKK